MISHATETTSNVTRGDVPIDAVDLNPENPRDPIETADVETLAESLRSDGLLQPIGVRPLAGGSRYELIFGARRLLAARAAGLSELPANIYNCDNATALMLMVQENLQRKKLNPIETARALELLHRPIEKGGAGLKHEEIATRFGKSASWVSNSIRILRLPEVWQARLASREISRDRAMYLLRYVRRPDVLERFDLMFKMRPELCRTRDLFEHRLDTAASQIDGTPAPEPLDSEYQRRQRRLADKAATAHRASLAETSDDQSAADPTAGDGDDAGEDAVLASGILNVVPPFKDGSHLPVEEKFLVLTGILNMLPLVDDLAHLDKIAAAVELRRGELQRV